MNARLVTITVLVSAVSLLVATGARARTFPGANGVIAYSDFNTSVGFHIWTVNPDGSGRTQLTNVPGVLDESPRFSPDGRLIVFNRQPNYGAPGAPSGPDVVPPRTWVMNADGSGQRPIGPPSSQTSS